MTSPGGRMDGWTWTKLLKVLAKRMLYFVVDFFFSWGEGMELAFCYDLSHFFSNSGRSFFEDIMSTYVRTFYVAMLERVQGVVGLCVE